MTHVLETGFETLNKENPNGSHSNGLQHNQRELRPASDGKTFESRNPAWLDDCLGVFPLSTREDVHDALISAREAFSMVTNPCSNKGPDYRKHGKTSWSTKTILSELNQGK